MTGPWNTQAQYLGAFIRNRRKLARLSLRQLAATTSLSNAYLSQLERGLHLPSVRVLKLLSEALNVSAETLLAQAGLLDSAPPGDGASPASRGLYRAPSFRPRHRLRSVRTRSRAVS